MSLVRHVVQDMSEKGIPDGRYGGALVDASAGDGSAAMESPHCEPRCHKSRRSVGEVKATVQAQRKGLANNEQCTQHHHHCSLLHPPALPA
jgi:hypothetical protein